MPAVTITIERRFNGPPGSGHGGWSAGSLAELTGSRAAAVSLRRPPPLGRPLHVRAREGGGLEALDGDALVLEAEPLDGVEVDAPPAVGPDAARAASTASPWGDRHPFPTCFACGPERAPGDGLRLFPGPVGDGVLACPWTPAREFAGDDGAVVARAVWAALDCPTAAPFAGPEPAPVVLARLAVALRAPVRADEPHVVGAWAVAVDGRKRRSAGVLWDAAGGMRAVAEALWIELRR
jgi:hypothetical protein